MRSGNVLKKSSWLLCGELLGKECRYLNSSWEVTGIIFSTRDTKEYLHLSGGIGDKHRWIQDHFKVVRHHSPCLPFCTPAITQMTQHFPTGHAGSHSHCAHTAPVSLSTTSKKNDQHPLCTHNVSWVF